MVYAQSSTVLRSAFIHIVFRILRETGALAASLGGLDAFVFTAGIGENAAAIRAAVAERLGWLGLTFDLQANEAGATRISAPSSRLAAFIIPTNEEAMIARHTLKVIREDHHS